MNYLYRDLFFTVCTNACYKNRYIVTNAIYCYQKYLFIHCD